MKKALAYLRVSGKGQLEGDGFERQRLCIQAYADAHDIQIQQWYEERGVCGAKDLDDRPALQELIASLSDLDVGLVLIEKLDRLARAIVVQETILGDLKRKGHQLVSATEPDLCSDDPTRTLLRQMMGAIAEYERKMIVLKLRGARQRIKAKVGRCEGRKPFGTHPGEDLTLERMRDLEKRGWSLTAIAQQLNEEQRCTREGGIWFPSTVGRILNRASNTLPGIGASAGKETK